MLRKDSFQRSSVLSTSTPSVHTGPTMAVTGQDEVGRGQVTFYKTLIRGLCDKALCYFSTSLSHQHSSLWILTVNPLSHQLGFRSIVPGISCTYSPGPFHTGQFRQLPCLNTPPPHSNPPTPPASIQLPPLTPTNHPTHPITCLTPHPPPTVCSLHQMLKTGTMWHAP